MSEWLKSSDAVTYDDDDDNDDDEHQLSASLTVTASVRTMPSTPTRQLHFGDSVSIRWSSNTDI